jgi:hypothetical protein
MSTNKDQIKKVEVSTSQLLLDFTSKQTNAHLSSNSAKVVSIKSVSTLKKKSLIDLTLNYVKSY